MWPSPNSIFMNPRAYEEPLDLDANTDDQEIEDQKLDEIGNEQRYDLKWESDDARKKGWFEKIFGANLNDELPNGYESWNPVQQSIFKANAGISNVLTRAGGRAAHQIALPGTGRLVSMNDLESLQEFNGWTARKDLNALKEIEKTRELTEEEKSRKFVLEGDASRWYQQLPEGIGFVGEQAVEWMIAGEVLKAAGATKLLNAGAKKFISKFMPKVVERATDFTVKQAATTLDKVLITSIESAPNTAMTFFAMGALTPEQDSEDDLSTLGSMVKAGRDEALYAIPVIALSAGGVFLKNWTKLQPIREILQGASAKTAALLAKARTPFAKKTYVRASVNEAVKSYELAYDELMPKDLIDETTKMFKELADEVVTQSKANADLPAATVLNNMKAAAKARTLMADEITVPKVSRNPIMTMDDAVVETSDIVGMRTKYMTVKQGDGLYAILDKENMFEVATGIKRKHVGEKLDDIIFGVKDSTRVKKTAMPKNATKLTVTEEVELKRSIKHLNSTAKESYRAGVSDAKEKAAINIAKQKERITSIRTSIKDGIEKQAAARELVLENVPKEDQGKFFARIIKSRTEGGMDDIVRDIETYVNSRDLAMSVEGIRDTFNGLTKMYGKNFDKAPDEVAGTLRTLYNGIDVSKKKAPVLVSEIPEMADDLLKISSNLQSKLGIIDNPITPEVAEYLGGLNKGSLTVGDVRTLDKLLKIVAHRAGIEHKLFIKGEEVAINSYLDDLGKRLIPRKVIPDSTKKKGLKDLIGTESDHPITLSEKMFGKDSSMSKMMKDLWDGESIAMGIERDAFLKVRAFRKANGISDETVKGLSKEVKVTLGGKETPIQRDELLDLFRLLRDPDNFDELMKSDGLFIKGETFKPTVDELGEVLSKLSEQEKAWAGVYFDINNKFLSPLVNETSLKLNGVKLFTDPLHASRHRHLPKIWKGNQIASSTYETKSLFLPRTGGKAAIKLNGFNKELANMVQASSKYSGMAIPTRNLKTVLNNEQLIKGVDKAGFTNERNAMIDIFSRAEGMYTDSSVVDNIGSEALNRFTTAVLGYRTSTIGTQIMSVPAAKSIIPRQYFRRGDFPLNNVFDEIERFDPGFFWQRWDGKRISFELGNMASKNSIDRHLLGVNPKGERAMKGLIWGDRVAIGKIYMANKRWLKDTTDLVGDDLIQAAVSKTEEVTRLTQPTWSLFNRSKMATDTSVFKRGLMMFRTAQEAQNNILKRAYADAARTGDKTALRQAQGAVAESVISVAVWKNSYKWARRAGITAAAGYFGLMVPEGDENVPVDAAWDIAKTGADLVPGGRFVAEAVDVGIQKAIGNEPYKNKTKDPISNILVETDEVMEIAGKYLNEIRKKTKDGETAYGIDVEKETGITKEQIIKDIVAVVRTTSLITGKSMSAPIDEWVYPALKRSKYQFVKDITIDSTSDAVYLQREVDSFLTRWSELSKKNRDGAMSSSEAKEFRDNKWLKSMLDDTAAFYDLIPENNKAKTLQSLENTFRNRKKK